MIRCRASQSLFPRECLSSVAAILAFSTAAWLLPAGAQAEQDIAAALLGDWELDREATSERLSEKQKESEDAPADLPPFELTLQFEEENVTTNVVVGSISKRQTYRWRVLEELSDSAALLEFLPTTGLPRRHKFRVLAKDRLALDAQGAKYTLILTRRTTP